MADEPDNQDAKDAAADAGADAASKGLSADEAKRIAQEAARAELKDNQPSLSDEQLDALAERVADKQIDRLEKRGVFDAPEPTPAAEPAERPAEPTDTDSTASKETDTKDEKPKKRSAAARFFGYE